MANHAPQAPAPRAGWTLERWVHQTLLSGVLASGLLLALGVGGVLIRGRPRPVEAPSLRAVIRGVAHAQEVDLLYLGLLVLMATPVLRVAVLAVGWGLRRDDRFCLVSLVVLALLVISFFLGVG